MCADTRGDDISDSETCKYAAKRLNVNFISSVNDARKPKGCYVDFTMQGSFGRKVHYNENLNSLRTDDASPFCKTGKYKKGYVTKLLNRYTLYIKTLISLL